MPLPLIPLAVVGIGGLITGAVVSGDRSDAQVIVNPAPKTSLNTTLLLGSAVTAFALVYVVPKISGK